MTVNLRGEDAVRHERPLKDEGLRECVTCMLGNEGQTKVKGEMKGGNVKGNKVDTGKGVV